MSFYSILVLLHLLAVGVGNAQLCTDFYDWTCPKLESIVRHVVRKAVQQEPRMGASLLRLHFHDCFVNGCDGSVLLDDTPTFTGEKTARPNANSLRGFDVIDHIKIKVERKCPGVVSCADIAALAALYGTIELGGPRWILPLGRRDSTTANLSAANSDLPAPFLNLTGLINAFAKKGFTPSEMVALSGSHTIGEARCVTFRSRIYNESSIDPRYAIFLRQNCPSIAGNGDNNLAALDVMSPDTFDNGYYKNLQSQLGLLHSDQQLVTSPITASKVGRYAVDNYAFFDDFAQAMTKMSKLSPLTGTQGQIRDNCRRVNPSSNIIAVMEEEQGKGQFTMAQY